MSKFTAGKWNYINWTMGVTSSTGAREEKWYLVGSSDNAVGLIRHEGDARLIVAAPEMYELVQYLCCFSECTSCTCENRTDLIKEAKELLARIDGEEAEA